MDDTEREGREGGRIWVLRHNHDTEDNEVMKMSRAATKEYVLKMRERYGVMRNKKAKGRVLDEFCATTDLGRKHAIKVLRARGEPLRRSGRKPVYGLDVAEALKGIWLAAGQPCSKLMRAVLGCYVMSYEKHHGIFPKEVRRQVLSISPSSIDRLLRLARLSGLRRRRSPLGLAAVKREVPIRAGEWNVTAPGWIEADTVGHGGGSAEGSFVWSLTMTDILTQWTEIRVIWCRGATGTFERIQEIEKALPFALLGFDSDNGPEFLNWHLHAYFKVRSPAVSFTRSRPYHKNDNAHVEQKNGTHVRGLLGHERIDDRECVDGLNEAVRLWSLWKNLFGPVMKLVAKRREGHRYIKTYDQPKTPVQRVLDCASVSPSVKRELRKRLVTTDCFSLKRQVDQKLREVFEGIRNLQQRETVPALPGPGPSALRAAPSGTVPVPGRAARPAGRGGASARRQGCQRPMRMVS